MIAEGTPPDRFALEHAHYSEDLPFWVALAEASGGPVLDIGAAVGRVSLPIARRGIQVVAFDGSRGMLDQLAEALTREPAAVAASVTLRQGDFRTLDLGGRQVPLAIMPMNSLQALLTRSDQLACLTSIRRHLLPSGVFAFDVVLPDLEGIAAAVGVPQPGPTWHDPGSEVTVTHTAWYDAVDPDTGTVSFTSSIDEQRSDGSVESHLRPHTVHLFSPTELWALLHEAGFVVQAVYGDFAGAPLEGTTERQIYRCGVAP